MPTTNIGDARFLILGASGQICLSLVWLPARTVQIGQGECLLAIEAVTGYTGRFFEPVLPINPSHLRGTTV